MNLQAGFNMISFLKFFSLVPALVSAAAVLPRDGWKIPSTSFDSTSTFNTYWAYNYPWGTDHNGGARMNSAHVAVGGGQLTLTADYVTGQASTSSGVALHYLSGTVYAKQ